MNIGFQVSFWISSNIYAQGWDCRKVKVSLVQLFVTPWTVQSMEFSRPEYWNGQLFSSPGNLSNLGIKLRSPVLQADSSPAEPQRKPKNTGLVSLSLLPWIFPTQKSSWRLLHCRQILYQLSYEGSSHINSRESPGAPVVKTPHFHCWGCWFDPQSKN